MKYIILSLIIFVHVTILTKVMFFPYPEFFIYPYLTNHGLKPYNQILDQHFPGLMFLPINLDNLGMNNENIARVWSIMIVVLIQILIFAVARKILKDDRKALFVNVLYLFWQPFFEGWVFWIDSFLPIMLLPAFYALYKKRLFFCGLFLGLGIVFKQTLIPLAFLILVYTFWQEKKLASTKTFLLGLAGPIGLMLAYIIAIGVFNDFIFWTIIFNLTTYAKYGTSIPPTLGYVSRIFLVYLGSLTVIFHKDKRLVQILLIFLIGSLVGVFDRADFVHLQPSLPFALLGTVIGLDKIGSYKVAKFSSLVYLLIAVWWMNIFYKGHLSNKIFFFDDQTKEIASKIQQYTKPGEKIFIFGAVPHLYQMSNTLPAGDIFVFQFPWFLSVAGDRVLDGIRSGNPRIVVSDRTVNIENQSITEFGKNIDRYLGENYHEIDRVGTTEILLKNNP